MLSIIFSCIFTSRFIPGITNLFLIINYDQPLSLKWNKTTKKSDSLALSPILLFCARFLLLLYAVRTAAAACSLGKMAAIGKVFAINNAEAWKDIIWIIGVIFHAYWIGGGVREEWAASGAYYARTAPIKIVKNFASCGGGAGIREEKTHALGGNLIWASCAQRRQKNTLFCLKCSPLPCTKIEWGTLLANFPLLEHFLRLL